MTSSEVNLYGFCAMISYCIPAMVGKSPFKGGVNPEKTGQLLFSVLEDRTLAPDHLLPLTGVSVDLEKSLSSIFVTIPSHQYGTRTSTLLLFEKKNIYFCEKTFFNAEAPSLKISSVKIQMKSY